MTTTVAEPKLSGTDNPPPPDDDDHLLCLNCHPIDTGEMVTAVCGAESLNAEVRWAMTVDEIPCILCRAVEKCPVCGASLWD